MTPRPIRAAASLLLVLGLAACGGGPAPSGPAGTSPAGTSGGPATSTPAGTAAAIDLANLDVCALVAPATVEALTGETGFATDESSMASAASCFWGVTRAGVPQYLDVSVFRRDSLAGYTISPNGVACPSTAVPGVGVEAVGGVCTGDQTKVWLAAMDRGVAVQVIVNEPKGTLSPADLADAVNAVIAGLE